MPPQEHSAVPEYASRRLLLRRFAGSDIDFVREVHSNPDLARFVPSAVLRDHCDAQRWIDSCAASAAPARGWWCVTLHDGTPVGAVVLKPIQYSQGHSGSDVEIGWRWHADHTGLGYATEAASLLMSAGFASGLEQIIAVTRPDNHASAAVCRRIDMTEVGLTRKYQDQTARLFRAHRPREHSA